MPFLEELKKDLIDARAEALRERQKALHLEERNQQLEKEVSRLQLLLRTFQQPVSDSPTARSRKRLPYSKVDLPVLIIT